MIKKCFARPERILALFLALAALFFLVSCGTAKEIPAALNEDSFKNQSGEEFSSKTVIVYLKSGTSAEEINALAEKFHLGVLYLYKNFDACALSSEASLSERELDSLVSALEKEGCVLSAQKDRILSLD